MKSTRFPVRGGCSARRRLGVTATIVSLASLTMVSPVVAQDPNFHIYLGFGQSNMEGNAKDFSGNDKVSNPRFQVMSAVNCSNPSRTQGKWAAGVAPLVRCNTGLSPLDYFGRTLVDSLPSSIKIGVVPVAVAGSKIEGFDLGTYQAYYAGEATWMKNIVAEYGGNPYARLVSMAKEAQKSGVIRGILLHQGESNNNDANWPTKVNKIYTSLLKDLGLEARNVPLLVGELVGADQGGACASHNNVIAKVPQTIPTAHVISSKGCTDIADNLHFSAAGYRELGKRYAQKMLALLRTMPTHVAPESAFGPAAGAGDVLVYDLRGTQVGGFHSLDAQSREGQWETLRRRLPQGVYWLRDPATGTAWKRLNGL